MSTVDEATFGSFTSAKDFLSTVFVAHEDVIEARVKGRKITASAAEAETEDLLFGKVKTHQKAVGLLDS